MAQFETSAGIEGITGKLNKRQSLTSRQKHFHYPDGRIFGCGPKEVYQQQQRDFKRNPRTPAEEAQHQRWTAACREAALINKDPNHPRTRRWSPATPRSWTVSRIPCSARSVSASSPTSSALSSSTNRKLRNERMKKNRFPGGDFFFLGCFGQFWTKKMKFSLIFDNF